MAQVTAKIVCHRRWWLKFYWAGVVGMSQINVRQPDRNRICRWIKRGIVIEVR